MMYHQIIIIFPTFRVNTEKEAKPTVCDVASKIKFSQN